MKAMVSVSAFDAADERVIMNCTRCIKTINHALENGYMKHECICGETHSLSLERTGDAEKHFSILINPKTGSAYLFIRCVCDNDLIFATSIDGEIRCSCRECGGDYRYNIKMGV